MSTTEVPQVSIAAEMALKRLDSAVTDEELASARDWLTNHIAGLEQKGLHGMAVEVAARAVKTAAGVLEVHSAEDVERYLRAGNSSAVQELLGDSFHLQMSCGNARRASCIEAVAGIAAWVR